MFLDRLSLLLHFLNLAQQKLHVSFGSQGTTRVEWNGVHTYFQTKPVDISLSLGQIYWPSAHSKRIVHYQLSSMCGPSVPHLLPMLLFLVISYCRCFGFCRLQTQNLAPHCPSGLAMRAVISNSEKRIDGQRKCNEVERGKTSGVQTWQTTLDINGHG